MYMYFKYYMDKLVFRLISKILLQFLKNWEDITRNRQMQEQKWHVCFSRLGVPELRKNVLKINLFIFWLINQEELGSLKLDINI